MALPPAPPSPAAGQGAARLQRTVSGPRLPGLCSTWGKSSPTPRTGGWCPSAAPRVRQRLTQTPAQRQVCSPRPGGSQGDAAPAPRPTLPRGRGRCSALHEGVQPAPGPRTAATQGFHGKKVGLTCWINKDQKVFC